MTNVLSFKYQQKSLGCNNIVTILCFQDTVKLGVSGLISVCVFVVCILLLSGISWGIILLSLTCCYYLHVFGVCSSVRLHKETLVLDAVQSEYFICLLLLIWLTKRMLEGCRVLFDTEYVLNGS